MSNLKKYYGYYSSPIGLLEICCVEDSLVSINFVEEKEQLVEGNIFVTQVCTQIHEYFTGNRKKFDIKISLEGTEFQKSVWKELIKIPYSKLVSYKDIAVNLQNEKAVRAVGNANRVNKIPIIIPCHRVVGSSGKLTGYAGGLDRKEWLIKHESEKL